MANSLLTTLSSRLCATRAAARYAANPERSIASSPYRRDQSGCEPALIPVIVRFVNRVEPIGAAGGARWRRGNVWAAARTAACVTPMPGCPTARCGRRRSPASRPHPDRA